MNRLPISAVCLAATALLMITGCAEGNRQLQSLTVSPASATANGSAVQFTATGHWSQAPVTETPMPANWGACVADGSGTTTDVTVSQTGLATCSSGAKGNYMVFAWDPQYGGSGPVCTAITACDGGCGRVSAQVGITCP